ncbi:thioredoxin family protein [Pseudoflavitalea sp. X16]|uniref:thioredoxin family protein n=1 Tax=Paraflavitalea devenefica TaxID=2716334 RepID=UPI0014249194|nr:thioredoxin family protein [Paraflavitalea devenefica]NII27412.1 thioredoxin family protein [Paraflavitalea devenefica]
MKLILFSLLTGMGLSFTGWQADFETAKKIAKEKDRLILLNFSGSDWCGPCIRLHKEVFDSDAFTTMSDSSLVLYEADFPRNKKNQLPEDLQKRNDALADQYNPQGKFPFTLLLTAEGKVVRTWDGYQGNSTLFIEQIKSVYDAHHH